MLYTILLTSLVFISVALIALILLQRGKGAEVGAAFGAGASGTVFGSKGSSSFLTHTTAVLAALFFIGSLALANVTANRPAPQSVIDTEVATIDDGDDMLPMPGEGETELPAIPEAETTSENEDDDS